MVIRKFLYLLLLIPSVLSAQTFQACPKPGYTTVTVLFDTLSSTVPIVIDELKYNGINPVITEKYDYASITQLHNNPVNSRFYGSSQVLSVDSTCGVLRMNLDPVEHTTPSVCSRYYTGYDLDLPAPTHEIFVEMHVKFDSGFVAQRPHSDSTAPGCSETAVSDGFWSNYSGFVMLMGRVDNGSGAFGVVSGTHWPYNQNRFEVGAACHFEWPITATWTKQDDEEWRLSCGHHILGAAYAGRGYTDFNTKLIRYDGKWHRYRFWFKAGNTSPNLGGVGVWIDDEHMGTLPIQDVTTDNLIGLSIGRFMWQRPVKQQAVEYGYIRIWDRNPGWNLCEKFCYQ